jgi:DNA-binding CsgD family transcriptional regulator
MRVGDVQTLTQRQKEILRLLLNGFDAKSAARELGISVHTVNEHLREARRHLGVSSSREAARILRQAEGIPPNDVGPNALGVADRGGKRFWMGRPGPDRRLAYAGASLVMFAAVAATALSIAHQGPLSTAAHALPKPTATKPGAGAQPDSYQYRDVAPGAFERVKVSGPFKVGVLISAEPAHVQLVGPPALLADTIVIVEGDTLMIRFREGATWSWNPGSGVNAVVFVPKLAAVHSENAATVEINGAHGDMFSASTDGSGDIVVRQLDVGHVQLATGGSGGITVEGRADDAAYVVGGSGSIDAKRLRVANASIAIGGSGSAFADVSKSANISVSGAGRVEIVGGATCVEQPVNSPQVDCR